MFLNVLYFLEKSIHLCNEYLLNINYMLSNKADQTFCFHDVHSAVRKRDSKWNKWQGNYCSMIKVKNEYVMEGHKEFQVQEG